MTNPAAVLDRVVTDLDQLLGADALMSLTDAERRVVLSAAGDALRRVEATIIETVATGDPVDLPNGAGCRNVNELLQRTLRVDSRGAARFVKAGKVVHRDAELTSGESLPARWPALRRAMLDGAVGTDGLLAATGPIESAGDRIGAADRWKADDGPVSAAVARHTGCTGAIQRVFTEQGRIVGMTVTDRIFNVHQRRAITLRDKECLIPGCHVPASWCEIHHVTEHSHGGPTSTDNGVPLCWWHHRSLVFSGWEIRMHDGLPEIRGPAWWDPLHHWRTPRLSLPDFAFT
ncbi:HNH endonuclease signature motif containing protein [Microbacterium esteraromaticum]|uniref:HNH endonuclease signature motif containing protein n=1 Tax=Microbacterium esteraromaticum TaxID=57043 RepID=UPI0019D400F3|nr:HNH endonuclease signature motif containing protein [Microbacterium esteraromaticum]MBN7794887.1 HNH endonuclease [Microbacterium esteraromaticum]